MGRFFYTSLEASIRLSPAESGVKGDDVAWVRNALDKLEEKEQPLIPRIYSTRSCSKESSVFRRKIADRDVWSELKRSFGCFALRGTAGSIDCSAAASGE